MKRLMIFILSLFVLQGILAPAIAQLRTDPICLETVWKRTNPSENDKQFDSEIDFDMDGSRFSCISEVSPTEVSHLYNNVKKAILTKDADALSQLVNYPFIYSPKLKVPDEDGSMYGFEEVNTPQELIERYDEITSPELINVMKCMDYSKLRSSAGKSVFFARGYIHFHMLDENIGLKLTYISSYDKWSKQWYSKHCE